MTRLIAERGYEIWAQWDTSARVYELFTEPEAECWIGCADTLGEAREVAQQWIEDRING